MKSVEQLFDTVASNGCREMTLERFRQAIEEHDGEIKKMIDKMIKEKAIRMVIDAKLILKRIKELSE